MLRLRSDAHSSSLTTVNFFLLSHLDCAVRKITPSQRAAMSALDAGTNSAARIASKQAGVIVELSATLNTLTSIKEILDDIAELTEPVVDAKQAGGQPISERLVTKSMLHLIAELQNWDETTVILQSKSNKLTSQPAGRSHKNLVDASTF